MESGRRSRCAWGAKGAYVVIADVDSEVMETTVQEMRGEGSHCKGVTCDVRDQAQVEAAVKNALGWHGRIDILMYIAGIANAVPFVDLDVATWDNTLDINLRGAFLTAKAVVPHMVERRKGKLVFMASTNSWDGEAQLAHYNVSKSGVFLWRRRWPESSANSVSTPMRLGRGQSRLAILRPSSAIRFTWRSTIPRRA